MPHNCNSCGHWQAKSNSARADSFSIGECRCNPPTRNFAFPRTKASDSCSQHTETVQFATAKRSAKPKA